MVWNINQFYLISFHVMTAVCSENKTVTPSVYFLAALHISCVFIHCHETVIKHQVLLQTQENCYRRTHSA